MSRVVSPTIATLLLGLPSCTVAGSPLPSRCEAIEVDPMRELVVTDPAVIGDPRVAFAPILAAVLGSGADDAARAWMDAWAAVPGEATIGTEVTGAWPASSAGGLDLTRAPFALVAMANRVDLSALGPDRAGELRFVYGLAISGVQRPLTVNVELELPPTRTPQEWATAWHALGSLTGDASVEALMSIVDSVLREPLHGQVRTQDARGAPAILLQFDLRSGAPLAPGALFNQPAPVVSPSALAAFVSSHQAEVLADAEVVPYSMLASSAAAVPPDLALPGVPSNLATAFANTTCSGCHTSEPTLDGTFHISPLRRGEEALSSFLRGSSSEPGELSRRAEILRGLLCDAGD